MSHHIVHLPKGKALWWRNYQNKGPVQGGSWKCMFWILAMHSFEIFTQHKVHTNLQVGWKNVTSQWKNKRTHKTKWKTKKSIWKLKFPSKIVKGKLWIVVPTLMSISFMPVLYIHLNFFLVFLLRVGEISKIKPEFHYNIILSYLFWK